MGYDRDSSLYAELLLVLGERLRRELKAPVMKRLANDWRNLGVVVLGASLKCLVAELGAEAPVQTCRLAPARDLPLIVSRSPALEETAIPLKPAVRVDCSDPSAALPHPQGSTTFDSPFVDSGVVVGAAELLGNGETLDPVGWELADHLFECGTQSIL